MGKEIERKYLVKNATFKKFSKGILYRQGYLSTDPKATVRVRIVEKQAYLTIKGDDNGISRLEYEYALPLKDAEDIINKLCCKPLIEKYRYIIKYQGHVWVVDEFIGDNAGLVIAEIELKDENEQFTKPDFIGEEITYDYKYRNSNLVINPYKSW